MKYLLSDPLQAHKAKERLEVLTADGARIEIIKVSPKRSLNQNNYLHLLLSAFGGHFGYTLNEAKLIYKELNRDVYFYEKKKRIFVKSSSDLTKEEMAKTIDKLMQQSARQGYELPPADNQEWIQQLENEAEQHQQYL
jgi:hypothetical protein